jgi:hypothetical protein
MVSTYPVLRGKPYGDISHHQNAYVLGRKTSYYKVESDMCKYIVLICEDEIIKNYRERAENEKSSFQNHLFQSFYKKRGGRKNNLIHNIPC